MDNEIKDEKFKLCLELLDRKNYDTSHYQVFNLDDELAITDVAILRLYFSNLPQISVYFYRDSTLSGSVFAYTPFVMPERFDRASMDSRSFWIPAKNPRE